MSTIVDTQVEPKEPLTKDTELNASAPGADVIGPNVEEHSAVRRRGNSGALAPGADAVSSAGGCKRPAPEMLACSCADGLHDKAVHNRAGLDCLRSQVDRAGGISAHGRAWTKQDTRNQILHEKRMTPASKAAQISVRDRDVTRCVCRVDTATGDDRRDPECLDAWKRFARDLHDGRIEQICILSDVERMESEAEELKQLVTEGADALSAKSKKERFDEQSWDSLKSCPLYEVLREYKDVLPDDIPAELPQDKGVQHEIDLVPGTA
ncbi:unnamed protein product [Phytophthora fragariaefolia]|uniref:Unnamed protein product n=1 Tax=Phytophthora fragariaefolia TaxID=1490495 RepID=A0A9W6YC54_9STRA|nr:unnamed protein product [Phytophthora fragariaefolia]